MKNFIHAAIIGSYIMILAWGMSACKSKEATQQNGITGVSHNTDNAKNSSNWAGTYMGIVPCADCEGISTQLTLKSDNTYSLQTEYIGEDSSMQRFEGTFQWNNTGSIVILKGLKEKSMPFSYLVGENKLVQMDMDGKIITGDLTSNYVLTKIDTNLVDKKWTLIKLEGVAISADNPSAVEAFITFNSKGNRVFGNSGCNNFSGSYTLGSGKQLKFSAMVSTRKMCIDMSVENQMSKLFEAIDNYTLENGTLSLNKENVSLARFVVK